MSKKNAGAVNDALEKALVAELKEIQSKHEDGENKGKNVYSLVDRMRVYDRFLKLEGLKLKVEDPEWGAKFRGED